MPVTEASVRSLDLPLGGNRTLRVTRGSGTNGETLVLAEGVGSGSGFHRPGWYGAPLVLPAAAIAGLRDALDRLEG